MSYSFASARCAWVPDNRSCTITVATHLLDHEWPLSYSLKASTCTSSTFAFACSWFCSGSLACSADISPSELNSLLGSVDSLHEINFNHNYDVFAFHLCLGSSASPLSLLSAEEFLELFKYITKRISCSTLLSSLSKLVMEALEARKSSKSSLTETSASKWILRSSFCCSSPDIPVVS